MWSTWRSMNSSRAGSTCRRNRAVTDIPVDYIKRSQGMHSTGPFFLPARSREEAIPDTNLSQVSKETWPEWHQTDRGLPGYPPALHLEDYGEHNKFVVATYFEGIFEEGKLMI